MTPVKYHETAEEELLHEIGYLQLRANGLGRRFLAEVQRTEKMISQFPESGAKIRPGNRKGTLRKFRHSLIYSIDNDAVFILAVAHHSRRPSYWVGHAAGGE